METQIKIIEHTSRDLFEDELNKIQKDLCAFATQTHIVVKQDHLIYVAAIFYKK